MASLIPRRSTLDASAQGASESKVKLFGIELDNLTMAEAVERAFDAMSTGTFCYATTPNVDHVMRLRHDERFRALYEGARFTFADGVPLLWAASLLGRPLKQRLNGTDLFENLCAKAGEYHKRVFLLGGNPGTAEAAAIELQRRHPELEIVGCECPRLGFDAEPDTCRALQGKIREAGADILFVGLGAPKQEEWIARYAEGTGAAFAIGIGVSFSFVGGEIQRAPLWMQKYGLEWLWRLCSEPSRLWRRYLLEDIKFIPLVLTAWASQTATRWKAAVVGD